MLLLTLSISSVISTASAFQSNSIPLQQKSSHDVSYSQSELQRQSVMLMAHPYGGYPPPPPFADPYMMGIPTYNNIYGPPPPHMRGPNNMRGPPPNYYQRPQDIISEADAILNSIKEEEEWKTDKQKAKDKKGEFIEGEVINFNPEQSAGGGRNRRPLKNAAAYPSDLDIDEEDEDESSSNEDGVEDSVFQGRMPGQPVNRNNNNNGQQAQSQGPKVPTTPQNNNNMEEDPRAQHIILDEYDSYMNDFFDFPITPQGMPQQRQPPPSRNGPAVYTSEEEELIAAMGGRQRMPPPVVGGGPQPRQVNDINGMVGNSGQRTTQEFAGLGTLTNNKGRQGGSVSGDPQQLNYNPEQNFNPQQGQAQGGGIMPPQGMPIMPPSNQASLREEGFLGDSTLKEISLDYSVPIPYLADVLATWGVPIPINPNIPLGDMITGEQTFAILEAIHTLDIGQLHEMYSEDNVMNICDYYDIDIKVAFDYCMERGWALPFGVRTFLRVEQEEELLEVLG